MIKRYPLHTVQRIDRIKLDLRVEKRLDGRGDVAGMVMAVFAMAPTMVMMVMVVITRHLERGLTMLIVNNRECPCIDNGIVPVSKA